MVMITRNLMAAAVLAALPLGAMAQNAASEVQRDVNQQQRIEQGLQSGALTTREASKLEREEAAVNRMQSRALKDGTLSPAEKARIERAQNRVSQDIYREKHDAQTGNPNSASSQRMQADVQRNINQQQRIEQGVQSGALTNRETAKLERGQARVEGREARAGADGHVGSAEERRIQSAENRQSTRIYREKHDRQVRQH
jgi:hypothetical protein